MWHGLAWANRCHHMTDQVESSGVESSPAFAACNKRGTPLHFMPRAKFLELQFSTWFQSGLCALFCWGNTYRSCKWNLLLRWAVSSIVEGVRDGEMEWIRSKCFDLCFCASTAVKTQMQRTVVAIVAVVAVVAVAVAVRVSLLAFSFKMFNYAAVLPHSLAAFLSLSISLSLSDHRKTIPMSSGATTCCSFIHSICQFCTRHTNPTLNPTASWTRSRFPARVKRLSPHLQHFYSLIIIILIIIIVIMIVCLQHDAAVSLLQLQYNNKLLVVIFVKYLFSNL